MSNVQWLLQMVVQEFMGACGLRQGKDCCLGGAWQAQ